MMNKAHKAYYKALEALSNKDYRAAAGFFKTAENGFTDDADFRILKEVTELLLVTKDEIYSLENEGIEIEEIFSNGQETEFCG